MNQGQKNPRIQGVKALKAVLDEGQSLNDGLDKYIVNSDESAFAKAMVYGVLREYHKLGWMYGQLVTKPLKAKDSDIKYLILLGLYQLYFGDLAEHAAINQTVGAVKGLKKLWAKGLVNATLRNAQRRHQELLDESSWPEECHHEHPKWLVETINNDWGDDAAEVIEANNQKAPMWIRVNALKHSAQEYQAKLNDVNIESEISNASDVGVLLKRPVAVTKLPDFDSGACSVQDESAQRAAQILDCQPDDVVLDVCAAPGGKTGHILERTPQISKVVAVDISESRLAKVRDNLTRLGFSEKAELTQGDATTPENWSAEQLFNRILLDVPCSGTGVIRRHPDIKYLRRPEDIDALAALQQEILRASWPLLKPGGTMLYATCSIISQENQQNIASFVAATSDANCISIEFLEAENCRDALGLGYRISPKSNRDGFYYALLKKAE